MNEWSIDSYIKTELFENSARLKDYCDLVHTIFHQTVTILIIFASDVTLLILENGDDVNQTWRYFCCNDVVNKFLWWSPAQCIVMFRFILPFRRETVSKFSTGLPIVLSGFELNYSELAKNIFWTDCSPWATLPCTVANCDPAIWHSDMAIWQWTICTEIMINNSQSHKTKHSVFSVFSD